MESGLGLLEHGQDSLAHLKIDMAMVLNAAQTE